MLGVIGSRPEIQIFNFKLECAIQPNLGTITCVRYDNSDMDALPTGWADNAYVICIIRCAAH